MFKSKISDRNGNLLREVCIQTGKQYRIEQLNHQAKKYRDRIGIVEKIEGGKCHFRFIDTNRLGIILADDLVPA